MPDCDYELFRAFGLSRVCNVLGVKVFGAEAAEITECLGFLGL